MSLSLILRRRRIYTQPRVAVIAVAKSALATAMPVATRDPKHEALDFPVVSVTGRGMGPRSGSNEIPLVPGCVKLFSYIRHGVRQ